MRAGEHERSPSIERAVQPDATLSAVRPVERADTFERMDYQHIQAEQRDGVLKLTLDRPDVLNSFNARMAEELSDALDVAARDEATRAETPDLPTWQ